MPNFSQSTSPPKSVRASDWTYQSSIGIDVHCKILVCCYQRLNPSDNSLIEERAEFPTGIQGIQKFAAWCVSKKPDIVMMEPTGVLWNTPYEAIEKAEFKSSQLALVNARDVKGRTGHKTDRNDAENLLWLINYLRGVAAGHDFRPARRFAGMLRRRLPGIIHAGRFGFGTSRLEGVNNRIKVIKRKAYGIRNFRYFVLKIRETFPGKGTSLWIGYPPGIAFLKTRVWSAYEQLDTYFPTKP